MSTRDADALVVFGITGDLAKKMTLRSLYRLERRELLSCPVIGVAVEDWTVDHLRQHARESIEATGEQLDPAGVRPVRGAPALRQRRLRRRAHICARGRRRQGSARSRYYLEIPPSLFARVIAGLAGAGLLSAGQRVLVEKPFGHDLAVRARAGRGAAQVPR